MFGLLYHFGQSHEKILSRRVFLKPVSLKNAQIKVIFIYLLLSVTNLDF